MEKLFWLASRCADRLSQDVRNAHVHVHGEVCRLPFFTTTERDLSEVAQYTLRFGKGVGKECSQDLRISWDGPPLRVLLPNQWTVMMRQQNVKPRRIADDLMMCVKGDAHEKPIESAIDESKACCPEWMQCCLSKTRCSCQLTRKSGQTLKMTRKARTYLFFLQEATSRGARDCVVALWHTVRKWPQETDAVARCRPGNKRRSITEALCVRGHTDTEQIHWPLGCRYGQ